MGFLVEPITLIATKKRKIADLTLKVVLNETTNDNATITKQPVQQGASISDHAFKEPVTLGMTVYFQDNIRQSLSEIYADLIELQEAFDPITVSTPKRIYKNMLIASVRLNTDKNTENCLAIEISFQQVILVPVTIATVPRLQQKNPGATGGTEKAGKKSGLLTLKNAFTGG